MYAVAENPPVEDHRISDHTQMPDEVRATIRLNEPVVNQALWQVGLHEKEAKDEDCETRCDPESISLFFLLCRAHKVPMHGQANIAKEGKNIPNKLQLLLLVVVLVAGITSQQKVQNAQ
jgi:hypothetical protein